MQRVSEASVTVGGELLSSIGTGLCVLVGVTHDDGPGEASKLAGKLAKLRVFADAEGKMNRSVLDVGGEVLVVSQFTLYGDAQRGNRPSYTGAADPALAEPLITQVVEELRALGLHVGTGRFGAAMEVALVNNGPVTIIVDVPAAPAGGS